MLYYDFWYIDLDLTIATHIWLKLIISIIAQNIPAKGNIVQIIDIYWKEKETHIHFECYLYHRCFVCVKESVFEMLNIHIWIHCDTFHCKQTTHVSCIYGKSDRGNASEIHAVCNNRENWFFKCPCFGRFGINWKLLIVYIVMAHENYATYEF